MWGGGHFVELVAMMMANLIVLHFMQELSWKICFVNLSRRVETKCYIGKLSCTEMETAT